MYNVFETVNFAHLLDIYYLLKYINNIDLYFISNLYFFSKCKRVKVVDLNLNTFMTGCQDAESTYSLYTNIFTCPNHWPVSRSSMSTLFYLFKFYLSELIFFTVLFQIVYCYDELWMILKWIWYLWRIQHMLCIFALIIRKTFCWDFIHWSLQ